MFPGVKGSMARFGPRKGIRLQGAMGGPGRDNFPEFVSALNNSMVRYLS